MSDDVDPKLTIAILQGYLRAAMEIQVPVSMEPGSQRFSDYLREEDYKLHDAIMAAVGK